MEYFTICSKLLSNHLLIAGSTGSGKSVFVNNLIYTIIGAESPQTAEMVLIDPKRVELQVYKNTRFCAIYARDLNESISALDAVIEEMSKRYKRMESAGAKRYSGKRLFVIIDELADLLLEDKKTIVPLLQKIAQLGRAAKITLILATQSPSRQILCAPITLNISNRVALHCQSAIESRQIIGVSGAEDLPLYGEALISVPNEPCILHLKKIPFLSDKEINSRCNFFSR